MPIKYLKYAFIASILDCIVLSYIYLEAFFTENYSQDLVSDFTLPLYTVPLIFLVLHLISNIKGKTYEVGLRSFKFVSFITIGLYYSIILVFVVSISFLIYSMLKGDVKELLQTTQYAIVEIFAITFAIQNLQKRRVEKLIFLILLWSFTILASYSILGFFEQYLAFEFSDELKLIYANIFFHLGNACFIFYL